MSARYLDTRVLPAGADNPAHPGRDAETFAPPPASAVLLAASMVLALLPIPFVFAHGPLWAAQRLLPPLRTAIWIALALNAAALIAGFLWRRLRAPVGVLTYRLAYLYGAVAWLSGLIFTYLLWGTGAVIAGIVCLGGGVVTTGLLSTLLKGEWQRFLTLALFVAVAFAARGIGLRLARYDARSRAGPKSAAISAPAAEPRSPSRSSMGGRS